MTATVAPPETPELPELDLGSKGGWRSVKNTIATITLVASFVVMIIPLGAVIYSVVSKGIGVISWDFLTDDFAVSPRREEGGIGPAVIGTIVITFWAMVLAIPLGILGAIYLHEYGGSGAFARAIRFFATVMTGVPSIVMGLFIFVVWTVRFGLEGFGGSLALACLMLPIIIRSTEEMLRLVPDELSQGSYALGNRKWRTILTVVLPAALPGIVSGCLLAVARAAGETAPLLFTIGAGTRDNWNAFDGANNALPTQIFSNANQPYPAAVERGWGAALTLVAIAFVFMIVARVVSSRFALER